jgi:short-chain fatty acids transporter
LLIVIISIASLIYLLHPSKEGTHSISKEQLKALESFDTLKKPSEPWFSNRLLWWPGFNFAVLLLGLAWLYTMWRSAAQTTELFTFDNINFVFLMLGLTLNYRPIFFLNAVEEAGRAVWGIIIQFPFYAGIYGLFTFTNLGVAIAQRFVAISTPETFPLITFWYTGVLNYFIPSGGAEWLVTSPYLVPTVETLHVPMGQLILAFAWGNMMTDMIQPFYAIPLLTVTKLKFRDIMGYLLLVFLLNFVITTTAFLIMPRL